MKISAEIKVARKDVPFELASEHPKKEPKFGCMKDKIKESDDHDWFEPLEDFKENNN